MTAVITKPVAADSGTPSANLAVATGFHEGDTVPVTGTVASGKVWAVFISQSSQANFTTTGSYSQKLVATGTASGTAVSTSFTCPNIPTNLAESGSDGGEFASMVTLVEFNGAHGLTLNGTYSSSAVASNAQYASHASLRIRVLQPLDLSLVTDADDPNNPWETDSNFLMTLNVNRVTSNQTMTHWNDDGSAKVTSSVPTIFAGLLRATGDWITGPGDYSSANIPGGNFSYGDDDTSHLRDARSNPSGIEGGDYSPNYRFGDVPLDAANGLTAADADPPLIPTSGPLTKDSTSKYTSFSDPKILNLREDSTFGSDQTVTVYMTDPYGDTATLTHTMYFVGDSTPIISYVSGLTDGGGQNEDLQAEWVFSAIAGPQASPSPGTNLSGQITYRWKLYGQDDLDEDGNSNLRPFDNVATITSGRRGRNTWDDGDTIVTIVVKCTDNVNVQNESSEFRFNLFILSTSPPDTTAGPRLSYGTSSALSVGNAAGDNRTMLGVTESPSRVGYSWQSMAANTSINSLRERMKARGQGNTVVTQANSSKIRWSDWQGVQIITANMTVIAETDSGIYDNANNGSISVTVDARTIHPNASGQRWTSIVIFAPPSGGTNGAVSGGPSSSFTYTGNGAGISGVTGGLTNSSIGNWSSVHTAYQDVTTSNRTSVGGLDGGNAETWGNAFNFRNYNWGGTGVPSSYENGSVDYVVAIYDHVSGHQNWRRINVGFVQRTKTSVYVNDIGKRNENLRGEISD